ncbi:PHP domain-containing protein [Flavobacteriaceae bacterium TP-CH-4]|uniref:PHP domain-containing protein n=1 Tax=Pelagihabitans pacificus TaxID=2696054 RepID=A0A967E5J5_9FLAO|nr:Sb-PDE family phosphodiesterase [Pelagihabitans pacificus]NHF58144.1 PHP domain-containing protein [Pelagihabitans pacificus]
MKNLLLPISFLLFSWLHAQEHSHGGATALTYPDIEGYITLKTDLHMHSVFSDGNVWPTIRVMEALREDLDAISLTEHLEYQPHKDDIPHPDRNRAYRLALEEAREHDLLIVPGSEITRSEPIGHSNAVFITDANHLLHDSPEDAFRAAKEQAAFVFWNHPAWYEQSPTGNPILSDFQKERIKNGELHGIEVINTHDYAEESLALALENDLTIMGTSDVHGLIDWDYTEKGNHRPVTLVFAKEKSLESLREALFDGRTVAVFNELLVGKSDFLEPLLRASIEVVTASYIEDTQVLEVVLKNNCSSDLLFENQMQYTFYTKAPIFEIGAGETSTLRIKTLERLSSVDLRLKALGAYTAPKQHPVVSWKIRVE